MTDNQHQYSEQQRAAIYQVIGERRDMRHFINKPIDEAIMQRLFKVAHQAPSVGYMQPWRIIRIKTPQLRNDIYQLVDAERIKTAEALAERQQQFMRLKVEGINDCAELLVMALMDEREPHVFGRRTMPEMDLASVSCAIQNMWLAARAEGIGMGWVSLFEPDDLAELLTMPKGAKAVAILCLGHVKEFYPAPMLAMENWRQQQPLEQFIFNDQWGQTD
ncbi:5,6-dimethylbenzimidazole synthase [Methylophaga sp. 42_8_T64]|nr:5,6-dimethylbenzimidazole synthase [Methylophaga sp. 41_12_T18]OUR85798.1 5,6-dimethylbenzimidazole synthase [Methylophaga sp. 42_8_T64]